MRTSQSIKNEKKLIQAIQDFDPKLKLRFNRKWDCYFITRSPDYLLNREENPSNQVLRSCLSNSRCSPHGEANELGEVVILAEITIRMMEHLDVVLRNVRKHLKDNFIPALANERTTRLNLADEKLMHDFNTNKEKSNKFFKDEMRAFGRDYHKTHVTPHVSFAG